MFLTPKRFQKRVLLQILTLSLLFVITLSAQTVKLKIIETTDEHGAAFPFDFTSMKPARSSLAQIFTYVKQERENKEQATILLSGGDLIQGTPLVYYYNFEKTDVPHVWAEMMNYMQYDAAAVGNHDIEAGHKVYDRINKEFNFPWLAANAVNTLNGKPYFKPYTIIKKDGIKIAVLGLITPAIPNWLPPKIWEGIEFKDMIKSAAKWIKIIKEKEKPDLMIGLFHSGVEYNYGNQNAKSPKNENASQLVAEQVPGFDIIFVGHDHHGWNYTVTNKLNKKVLILGGINAARDCAVANCVLTFDASTKKWDKNITGEVVEAKNFAPDTGFMNKFKFAYDEVKNYVSKKIGYFDTSISARPSLFGPSVFSDLINHLQLELTGADVSFTAPLSIDSKINKGDITVGDLFSLYRYENLLYTMKLTGREIKNYLEYSYSLWFNYMKDENDHLLNFKKDDKGNIVTSGRNGTPVLAVPYYNYDCAAGINYTVDLSKPAGKRITILSMGDGKPFSLTGEYKAAVNSYRGNGGGGHLVVGAGIPKDKLAGRIINSTDKDLRYYMMKWIEKQKTVSPKPLNNWKVIPHEWWLKGVEKDKALMFPSAPAGN